MAVWWPLGRDVGGRGEVVAHGHRGPRARCRGAAVAALRGPRARLPRAPRVRARALAQHARRLPDRPAPVRPLPGRARAATRPTPPPATSPTSSRDLAEGDGNGAPPCSTRHGPPQGRLPALLLPPPAPRGADRRRPGGRAGDAAARPEAARGPQLRARSRSCSPSRAATSRPRSRDRALLELMYASGLRASETIALEVSDVDLERRGRSVPGARARRSALVPVGDKAIAAVSVYLRSGRPKLVRSPRRARSCSSTSAAGR